MFLHGVETIEVEQGARKINVVKSAVIGLIGIAPTGAKNELVLVNSDTQAAAFGKQVPGFTIPQALDAIFKQGAGTVLVVNVLDDADNLVEEAAENVNVTDGKFKLAHPPIKDVVVTTDPSGTTYVLDTDYKFDAFGNFEIISGGDISEDDDLLVTYKRLDGTTIDAAQILGEVDGVTEARTGLKVFDLARNEFGFAPKIFIAPGFSTTNATAANLISVADQFKGHAIIDAPIGTTKGVAITGRGPSGTINFNYSNERALLTFPHVKAYDPATDANENRPLSQFMAGLIAKVHNELGFWVSPSNKQINGIFGTEIPLTAAINDPNSDVNLLNEKGIITLFNAFGTGLRLWGNRASNFPSETTVDTFYSVRVTADVINESIEQASLQFVDKPINQALIDAIVESVNAFLRTLQGRGAIIDGNCKFIKENNPDENIASGNLVFDYDFLPPIPGERLTFKSHINIEYLSTLGE